MIKVQECEIRGKRAYGITDGKKWWFYAFPTLEEATSMLAHFNTPIRGGVNISFTAPFKLVSREYGWDIKFDDGQSYRVPFVSNVKEAINIACMNITPTTPRSPSLPVHWCVVSAIKYGDR